ncbi:MAG TPA: hypothetical protein VFS10_11135, partial [Pyrinomonadaceae bacterium]|nr:hypothetical protein [Pyrinomonadaceae bacterium]
MTAQTAPPAVETGSAAEACVPEQYHIAEELEQYLGDPHDASAAFSFAEAVALDERDEYPAAACARLDAWGLPEFYVPEQWGGRLRSFEQLVAL